MNKNPRFANLLGLSSFRFRYFLLSSLRLGKQKKIKRNEERPRGITARLKQTHIRYLEFECVFVCLQIISVALII